MPILAFYHESQHLKVLRACLARETRAVHNAGFLGYDTILEEVDNLLYTFPLHTESTEKNLKAATLLNKIDGKPFSFAHKGALNDLESAIIDLEYAKTGDESKHNYRARLLEDCESLPLECVKVLTRSIGKAADRMESEE